MTSTIVRVKPANEQNQNTFAGLQMMLFFFYNDSFESFTILTLCTPLVISVPDPEEAAMSLTVYLVFLVAQFVIIVMLCTISCILLKKRLVFLLLINT